MKLRLAPVCAAPLRAVLALALAAPLAATAADGPAAPAKTAPAAKKGNVLGIGGDSKSAGGKLLTRAELRECLAEQPRLRTEDAEIAREQGALDARKAELVRQEEALAGQAEALRNEQGAIDRGSQQAVDAYNRRIGQHEEALAQLRLDIEDYNAGLPVFNGRADAHGAAQERWNAACAKRPYNEADLGAVQRGK